MRPTTTTKKESKLPSIHKYIINILFMRSFPVRVFVYLLHTFVFSFCCCTVAVPEGAYALYSCFQFSLSFSTFNSQTVFEYKTLDNRQCFKYCWFSSPSFCGMPTFVIILLLLPHGYHGGRSVQSECEYGNDYYCT